MLKNLSRKAELLDNAPCHLNNDELSCNIKQLFLPLNVTSLIQPFNLGVLENKVKLQKKKKY